MTTLVATDAALSGSILKTDAVFATAWNAVNGDSIDQNNMYVGIRNAYDVHRIALVFNTAAIPADAIIFSAYIALFQFSGLLAIDNIVVQNGQPTYPHSPVVVGDFDKTNYGGDGGSIPMNDVLTPQYRVIPLNAIGMGWINKGGSTKLLLRSLNDINGNALATHLRFQGPLGGVYDPKLIVNYFVSGQNMTVVLGKACDGTVWNSGGAYAGTRSAAAGTVDSGTNLINIGQSYDGMDYYVSRGFLYFDTSAIQIGANIADVQLVMTGMGDYSDTNFDITVQSGQPTAPSYPALLAADYDMTKYSGNYGTFGTAGFVVEGENRISLSTDFILNQLVVGGITKLCLRSSRDIGGNAPGMFTPEYVQIYSAFETSPYKRPKLEITFVGGRVAEAPGLIDIGWQAAQRGF